VLRGKPTERHWHLRSPPDPAQSAAVNRGAYMATALGHRANCHTPLQGGRRLHSYEAQHRGGLTLDPEGQRFRVTRSAFLSEEGNHVD
jgi:hypothetical protein